MILNVVVVSFGGDGDVHPMAAVALALRKRGHRVRFVSRSPYGPLIRSLGLDFTGFPVLERAGQPASVEGEARWKKQARRQITSSWLYQGFTRWKVRKRATLGSMRWLYELISRLHGTGQTVVVARVNAFGARIAQEKLGVPLVSVHLQPVIFRSEHDAPGLPLPEVDHPVMRYPRRLLWASIDLYVDLVLTPGLNAFRSELGLAPIRRPFQRWIHSPELVVGLFPDWFGPPQSDWPPNTHLTGFPLFDESSVRKVPSELESFLAAGAPPVVFTRGSQTQGARDFFDTSVKICRLTGHRGVLLTPSRVAVPGALPETVCHFDYVPFSAVFPRAAAVVHHGGIGTTGLALAGGVPQIVVPLFDDQSDNAARVQRLGAGVRVSPRAYRPKAVARKLERLLDSDEVAGACRSLAARIKGHDPLPDVCRLIEDVGARRR